MMRAPVRITSDVDATARVPRDGRLALRPAARDFAVHYADGSLEDPLGVARFTLVLRRPEALRRMLLPRPTSHSARPTCGMTSTWRETSRRRRAWPARSLGASTLRTRDTPTFAPTEKPRLDVGE
jgi:hypothetical protein